MKYLAILRDSLREAIDSKVLYVMLVLAALLILGVASISFRPITVEDDAQQFAPLVNFLFATQIPDQQQRPQVELVDVRQINDAAEPWKGAYTLTFKVSKLPAQGLALPGLPQPRRMLLGFTKGLLKQHFDYLEGVDFEEKKGEHPDEVLLVASSTGTKVENERGWKHEASLAFGFFPLSGVYLSLGDEVYFIEDILVNNIGAWVAILIAIVITSFFIPNMLHKGTVDLLIVKPINRPSLLVFKYLGGLSFMLITTAFVIVGIWLTLGIRSGIWATGFLISIPVLTFFFAILYSVSTLMGVLTRSAVVSILVVCVVWGLLFGIGFLYTRVEEDRAEPKRIVNAPQRAIDLFTEEGNRAHFQRERYYSEGFTKTVEAIHFILPRTGDLSALMGRYIYKGVLADDNPRLGKLQEQPFDWGESLGVSVGFIAVMLTLASLWFSRKDY